jgi:type I restriction enzyme R subunit
VAFSEFINDQSLNQRQINFVHKIINHMEQNGYMENVAVLQKPPFDKPISFLKLFDVRTRTALMKAINDVRENEKMTGDCGGSQYRRMKEANDCVLC